MQTAVASVAGLLAFRSQDSKAMFPSQRSRWEWYAGDWEDGRREWGRREWRAKVYVTEEEVRSLMAGAGAVNSGVFCGVSGGFIKLKSLYRTVFKVSPSSGRMPIMATLEERGSQMEVQYVINTKGSRLKTMYMYRSTDFRKLFPGGHAVNESIEEPHAYLCFHHGGGPGYEVLNARNGFECPRCEKEGG